MRRFLVLAVVAGIIPLQSCQQGFTLIEEGQGSRYHFLGSPYGGVKLLVIRDATAWQFFYRWHRAAYGPGATIPSVDFNQDLVVAALQGLQYTGGYKIHIAEVVKSGDQLQVSVELKSPAPGAPTTQVITNPYSIGRAGKVTGPVFFSVNGSSPVAGTEATFERLAREEHAVRVQLAKQGQTQMTAAPGAQVPQLKAGICPLDGSLLKKVLIYPTTAGNALIVTGTHILIHFCPSHGQYWIQSRKQVFTVAGSSFIDTWYGPFFAGSY